MNNWGQLAVFDLETTGVDVETARIVSACVAVLAADGRVIERWDWLADPGVEIPEGAAAVHGITTARARAEGRPAHVVVAEITQTLRVTFALGIPLVVYNAPYDLTLLDRECRRHQLTSLEVFSPVIDPLVIDKAVDRYRKGKRTLTATAELYHVTLDDAHDAGSDAIAAGRVAQALGATYPQELDITLPDLHGRQEVWYAEQAASFQDYIRSVKGDESYVSDTAWPLRPAAAPSTLVDTQPIPAPARRPSIGAPFADLWADSRGGTGVIGIEPLIVIDEPEVVEQVVLEQVVLEPDLDDTATSGLPRVEAAFGFTGSLTDFSESHLTAPALIEPTFFEQHLAATHIAPASRPTVLRVAAGIITDQAGRTLLVRKRGTTAFMQAGGKIEQGESALDALSRELREEIGHELDLDRTEYLGSFRAIAANEPDTVIRAEVFALAVSQDFAPSGEIEELLWLESGDVSGIDLAPLTRDTILPLWAERRSALF
jgi:DNA polymerase III epsilon subunit-like protein/8-oxo-dGTP pyrophosphatase MutT (NUDIX family)